jgi:3-hydroxybutyrate dehydrogenase
MSAAHARIHAPRGLVWDLVREVRGLHVFGAHGNAPAQSIAAEGDGKIRSFSVSTEYVKTPLVTNQIPDTAAQRGLSPQEVVSEVMLSESRSTEMMVPVEVANLFTFGLSRHGRHLNGGDLCWDGGMTLTY